MKIGIISQARTTSSRLPQKVLKVVNGYSMLEHHINRLNKCKGQLYIATTINKEDDAIVEICKKANTPYFRGDENNVLSRFYLCAKENELDLIVRVTSDCPFIDAELINKGIELFIEGNDSNLYISNCIERTYPRGFDFEIFSFKALEEAFQKATEEYEFEHVTPYINRNKSGKTTFKHIVHGSDKSSYRITLDTTDDFELIRRMMEEHHAEEKNHEEIISILNQHPELVAINKHIEQKSIH